MKVTVLFCLAFICLNVHCQPWKNTKRFVATGVDSVLNREWFITPVPAPSNSYYSLKDYYDLNRKALIILVDCKDDSLIYWHSYDFCEDCMKDYRLNSVSKPDSAMMLLRNCYFNYLVQNNLYSADTLTIDAEKYTEMNKLSDKDFDQFYKVRSELYDSLETFKYVVNYYTAAELKGNCIQIPTSDFRVKSNESWKNGKKDGEWSYYDLNGNERRRIVYQNGKKIRRKMKS